MRVSAVAAIYLLAVAAAADPAFESIDLDEPAHIYTGGWEHFVGGGVAVFDCDGDDLPELFAAGGSAPAAVFRNRSTADYLAFQRDTPGEIALTGVTGAYPLDIDSDGWTDLAVMRVGENALLRGLPDCRFEVLDLGFTSESRWTTAFSALWEGGQTFPTLAFGNYVDREDPDGPFEACDANQLYRPGPNGYTAPQELAPGYCALSMLFSDWGRAGPADLRISNDRHYFVRGGAEQLWDMQDTPRLYGQADGWRETAIWGMGIASRDVSGDGRPEIFLTSMGDQKLHSLIEDTRPAYADAPFETGITAHRPYSGPDGRPSTGWHAAFGDVNNDGLDDLFISKGNVEAMPGSALDDPNNLLIQQPDGRFVEFGDTAGLASMARGRGAALADLDLDGRLDVVVVNRNAPMEIYRNMTEYAGNWLLIDLRQSRPNTDAIGAFIEVRSGGRVQTRERTVGGGHAGGALSFEHFGVGSENAADVRVIWPDGAGSAWQTVSPNSRYVLTRSDADGAFRID